MLVSKEFKFEASHILPRHKGKCSQLHGHSWRVVVEVRGLVDPETQFVLDFAELKKLVQPLIDLFDHKHLNCFIRYPSSENVATYIAHELAPTLLGKYQYAVRVSETESTWADWSSDRAEDHRRLGGVLGSDAEWQSPQLENITDVYKALEHAQQQAKSVFGVWQDYQTEVEQLKLYMATMDFKPELPRTHGMPSQ